MSDATLAVQTGIPIDFVRAIRAVESGGSSTAVRFEPHVFWRIRKGLPSGSTGPQIWAALSQAELNLVPYTPGNTDWRAAHGFSPCRISRAASCTASETNDAAFQRAYAVNAVQAVQATSFGSFQVLGAHLLALYGNDPVRAVAAFRADPAGVSDALLKHWLAAPANRDALTAAQNRNVLGFVSRFNGCTDCSAYVAKFEAAMRKGGGVMGPAIILLAAWGLWKWLA